MELWLTHFTQPLYQVGVSDYYGVFDQTPVNIHCLRLLAEKHGNTLQEAHLEFVDNVSEGDFENFIASCPRLTALNLHDCAHCRWTADVGWQWLEMFPQLQHLSIDGNTMTRSPLY